MQVLGRYIPKWVLVVILLAAGAGATVGPVLAAKLVGKTVVSATQGLRFITVNLVSMAPVARFFSRIGERGVDFTVAFDQLPTNSEAIYNVKIRNESNVEAAAILTLDIPAGLEVALTDSAGAECNYGRIGPNQWELVFGAQLSNNVPQAPSTPGAPGECDYNITVAMPMATPPGYYEIGHKVEPHPSGGRLGY